MVRARNIFLNDYGHHISQARLDLGRLFNEAEYPTADQIHDRFSIHYRITPVPDAGTFTPDLTTAETQRIRNDIQTQIQDKLTDGISDLYAASPPPCTTSSTA